jgi:putative endonuclease
MKRREIGNLGERVAASYLRSNGYEIIETNYRCPYGEIDIIARKDATLVFVEVRTKTSTLYGSPEESITRTKMEHLLAVADDFVTGHAGLPEDRRIDVIAVRLDPGGQLSSIGHIENAVEGR